MKAISPHHEILLITNSSFGYKQWCKKEDETESSLSTQENVEEACANGLINELLPEVFNCNNHKMYLWQLQPGYSFLQLELGEFPLVFDKVYSVNPHNFLSVCMYN